MLLDFNYWFYCVIINNGVVGSWSERLDFWNLFAWLLWLIRSSSQLEKQRIYFEGLFKVYYLWFFVEFWFLSRLYHKLNNCAMPKTIGKYELHRTLGEGSFGKWDFFWICVVRLAWMQLTMMVAFSRVKYAVNKETNEAVAIKVLDKVWCCPFVM